MIKLLSAVLNAKTHSGENDLLLQLQQKLKASGSYRVLEPRMVFDGAAVDTAAEVTDATDSTETADAQSTETTTEAVDVLAALTAAPVAEEDGSRSIIFIDPRAGDIETLLSAASAEGEVVVLDATRDGVVQIAEILADRQDIDAIHIISHGEEGALYLGSTRLDLASATGQHADELATIGQALSDTGDILLYGCDVAGGENGTAFLEALAAQTGADIAASTDGTGSADRGGDWDLEARTGDIEATTISVEEWQGLLAPMQISVTSEPIVTGSGDVGTTALWVNAGTLDGESIDLRATVTALNSATLPYFGTSGDDPFFQLTGVGSASVVWEVFKSGTNQTVFAFGNPTFSVADIDGIGGEPFTRETVSPSLESLTGYATETDTNIQVFVQSGLVEASGTQDQNGELSSLVSFTWNNVASWEISYRMDYDAAGYQARFIHDGDGDFVFVNPNSTEFLSIDLDGDDSTAAGTAYLGTFTEDSAPVVVVDADVSVLQHEALGTEVSGGTVTLTNAQAGDQLLVGGSDASSGVVNGFSFTKVVTADSISITLSGTGTPDAYAAALQQITFNNTSDNPATVDRQIAVNVTNATYNTTSNTVLSTIRVVSVNDAPVAQDDAETLAENASLSDSVLVDNGAGADSDPEGDPLTVTLVNGATFTSGTPITLPSGARLTMNADGTYSYDPSGAFDYLATGQTGTDSFTYTISDGQGGTDTATVTFTVTGVNTAPVLADDGPVSVTGGETTNIAVLANDSDPEGEVLTVTHIIDPADPTNPIAIAPGGSVTLSSGTVISLLADGSLDVTTSPFAIGAESFDYVAADPEGATATATVSLDRAQADLFSVPPSVTGTEDNPVALGITVDPALVSGGSQLDIIGTEAGFRDASAGTTPTTFTIPAGTTAIRITAVGGNDNGALDADNEDYQRTSITVDLSSGTYAGQIFHVVGRSTLDNDNFAFADVPLGSSSLTGTLTGDTSNALNDITVSVSGSTLSIVETQTLVDQAYLVEYLTSTTSSSNLLGSFGDVQAVGDTSSTIALPAEANFVVLSIQDGRGGLDYLQEDKGIGRIVVDLDTGLASGTIFAQTGSGDTRTAAYAFSGYDISSGLSILNSGATITGDTAANTSLLPDLTISRTGDSLVVERSADAAALYTSLVSGQIYDRLDIGSGATALGATAVAGEYIADQNIVNTFDLPIAGGAESGKITFAMTNITVSSATNENTGTGEIFVDLVNGTTSGSFLIMRNQTPDLVSWTDVPFGTRLIDSPNTTTNHASVDEFADQLPAVIAFETVTQPDGSLVLRATAQPESGDGSLDYLNYAVTMQAQWDGRLPLTITGVPAEGSLSAGSFDAASNSWLVDPADAADLQYIPPADYSGDGVTLTVSYGSQQETVNVLISRVADTPTITTLDQSGDEDTAIDISSAVSAAVTDVDGSESISLLELNSIAVGHTISDGVNSFTATDGNQAVDITGWNMSQLTYRGAADANGVFTIGVRAQSSDTDGFSATADTAESTASFQVTILPTNDAPTALDDAEVVGEDAVLTGENVLLDNGSGADFDIDGADVLSVIAVNGAALAPDSTIQLPSGALLTIAADGSYSYDPNGVFNGLDEGEQATDSFQYTISDGNGGSSTATVTITINGANDAPVIIDPTDPGTPENPNPVADPEAIIPASNITDGQPLPPIPVGDYVADPDGEALTFALDPATTPAWLSIDPTTGDITGTPPADASQNSNTGNPGEYRLTVTITDPDGATATTGVTLNVANLAPVAVDDVASVGEDDAPATGNVLTDPATGDGDAAPDGDALTVAAAEQDGRAITLGQPFTLAGGGTLTLNADGSYSFDPGQAYNGLDVGETATEVVRYTIDDGNGGTDTALLTITINGANDAPVAEDDTATTMQDHVTTITVLDNDSDVDGDPLRVIDAYSPDGTVSINPDGTLRFLPNPGFFGEAEITYQIMDDSGATATATVMVKVIEVPATPDLGEGGAEPSTLDVTTGGDHDPLSAEGAVLDAVHGFGGLSHNVTPIAADGVVLTTVNNVSPLNGMDGTAGPGQPSGALPLTHETAWQIEDTLRRHGFDGLDGLGVADNPQGPNGFTLYLEPQQPQDNAAISPQRHSTLVLNTLVRAETFVVHIACEDGDSNRQVQEYRILQADGRPLPGWLERLGDDVLIGKHPADLDHVGLRITALYSDGSTETRMVSIATASGAPQALATTQPQAAPFEAELQAVKSS